MLTHSGEWNLNNSFVHRSKQVCLQSSLVSLFLRSHHNHQRFYTAVVTSQILNRELPINLITKHRHREVSGFLSCYYFLGKQQETQCWQDKLVKSVSTSTHTDFCFNFRLLHLTFVKYCVRMCTNTHPKLCRWAAFDNRCDHGQVREVTGRICHTSVMKRNASTRLSYLPQDWSASFPHSLSLALL